MHDRFIHALKLLALVVMFAAGARAAEPAAILLNGTVVTPERVIANGWVAIQKGRITAVAAQKPNIPGAREIISKDYIFPGFVDLHNHPLYAMFPRWVPNQKFSNRYQWRNHPGYHKIIQTPEDTLVQKYFCDMNAYGELMALLGGTTSITGLFPSVDTPKVEPCIAGLVRNLDWASGFHGAPLGQERVGNVLGIWPSDQKASAQTLADFRAGKLDLISVHLGEGKRADKVNISEFAEFEKAGLLTEKTAIIHGISLGDAEFAKMASAGTALIWSPRSNFELYGTTADIRGALRRKVAVALAPDWSPTGSLNMLAELAYAARVIAKNFEGDISNKQLFEMTTSIPARIAKIDDKVGSVKQGLHADLFMLSSQNDDPYDALTVAKPEDVSLVMVNGVPLFGTFERFAALGMSTEETVAICKLERAVNAARLPEGGVSGVADRLYGALASQNIVLGNLVEC
jgi:cytosine/adenosine deaminase-related metal-dependent hydrolase